MKHRIADELCKYGAQIMGMISSNPTTSYCSVFHEFSPCIWLINLLFVAPWRSSFCLSIIHNPQ